MNERTLPLILQTLKREEGSIMNNFVTKTLTQTTRTIKFPEKYRNKKNVDCGSVYTCHNSNCTVET